MRDSGLAWIGPIPRHWAVKKLSLLARVRGGVTKSERLESEKLLQAPYLRVANVQDGYLNLEEVETIGVSPEELERYRLRPGDVLMNEGGDFDKLGRGSVWRGEIDDCVHQNHVFCVRPLEVEPEWLSLVTSAECSRFYFMMRSKQSTNLASISLSNLSSLPVPVPPSDERQEILQAMNSIVNRLNLLKQEAESATILLQERRSALIAAAVTGKIDVRNYVPQHTPAADELYAPA